MITSKKYMGWNIYALPLNNYVEYYIQNMKGHIYINLRKSMSTSDNNTT